MIIALFALSLVMIIGGAAAVIQGFPYVRLESGLAMVVGGSTAASAGVILLGLAVLALRLGRIEGLLAGGAAPRASAPALPPLPHPSESVTLASPSLPAERPALAGAAGLAGLTVGAAGLGVGLGAGLRGPEPVFDDPPLPGNDPAPEDAAARAEEPLLPDLLPPEAEAAAPEPLHAASDEAAEPEFLPEGEERPEDEDLFAAELRPALDAPPPAPEPEPEPAVAEDAPAAPETPEAPEAAAPRAEERQVVGTYSSGGNTYVMFSDGKIEAETPRGRFTFDSLEELKTFVDSGGEANARGAA